MSVLIAFSLLIQTSHAKLPPQVFLQQQARAEEQLRIRITSVTATPAGDGTAVVAEATVQTVDHSKSGLKRGQAITIYFTRIAPKERPPGWTGADRSGPYLSRGETTCAFLNKRADGAFSLGAANRSFPSSCPSKEALAAYKPTSAATIRVTVQALDERVNRLIVKCQHVRERQGSSRLTFEAPSSTKCRVIGTSDESALETIFRPTESGSYGCFPTLEARCIRLKGSP